MAVPALKRWIIVVVCVLAGLAATAVVSASVDQRIAVNTQVLVTPVTDPGSGTPFGSLDYVEQRARSYARIVGTSDFRDAVAQDVGAGVAELELAARTIPSTALVEVSGTASSESLARQAADTATVRLIDLIDETEAAVGQRAFLRADEVQGAGTAGISVSPDRRIVWAAGPLAGLAIGVALAYRTTRRGDAAPGTVSVRA